ncbi:adenylate/guanylate cyclase domain-containing protein [Ruegeria lacuscaerulensis]|uniref:adenylate/guanylate cyclase domain-containing protein n=1 Tax=Ruegeria lacuscaerulensis TaxID=55218 RepID=UPI00147DE9E4|nr:adenylate/guanylate cyclase domain-containing protein [Ruegeria lacuscaerulensis]
MERRLAAILVADVVGYTRLMGQDEAGTLERLSAVRSKVIQPLIAQHHGRIFKLVGDGLLAEFASVVDAITCAIEWQRTLIQGRVTSDGKKPLSFRIGLNLGDVIVDGDDLLGEGVNIAARLEAQAEPDCICLSEDAYRQVAGKVEAEFEDLGNLELKNVDQPVRAYQIALSGAVQPAGVTPTPSSSLKKPTVAVLPFHNLSGENDQEYFADGVSEDIISALSRNRWLMVIARNSSFAYKGETIDVKKISSQLGVRYVLDGSVRKGGNRIRIAAQLIDAASEKQIWAERYDRVLEDIFAVQDEVTGAIVAAIAPELDKAEQQRATSKKSGNLNAWDVYQRGMWHLYKRTKEDLTEARKHFEAALSQDPCLSLACSGLVDAYYYEVVLGLTDTPAENCERALRTARMAVELDPDDAAAHCAMGKARIVSREHENAIPDLKLAIELNPSLAWAHYGLGAAAVFLGNADDAIPHLEGAIRLSPRDQHMGSYMVRLAEAYLLKHDYPLAIEWGRKALQQQGFQWSRYAVILAGLGYSGRTEEAARVFGECLIHRPDFSVSMVRRCHLYTHAPALEHYLDGLRKAGLPE